MARITKTATRGVAVILGGLRFDPWQFRDLMPLRFRIVAEQEHTAFRTSGRVQVDHSLDWATA